MATDQHGGRGNILPPRFLLFCAVAAVAIPLAVARYGWSLGTMVGFDAAAGVFLIAAATLFRDNTAETMRRSSRRNDANRVVLLAVAALATLAVLAAVASELGGGTAPTATMVATVIATLTLSWLFGNTVYALHYAHLYYLADDDGAGDAKGIAIPNADEPNYWDFVYFAFTLGMTFQTSDVEICTTQIRRIATAHSLVAFVFNLGVIAFTVNVLGS